jgi:glutathione S-transferase
MTKDKYVVYGDSRSGNCYKIKLLCSQLSLAYEWREVDILAGDTRTAEFLAMNANGKIPLLALPDGRYLAESNAILAYLADGSELAGSDRFARAAVLQWMFFEQYSHEPNIATSRFIIQYLGNPPDRQAALEEKRLGGYKALEVMEQQLGNNTFMLIRMLRMRAALI